MKWTIRISAILAPALLFVSGVSAQQPGDAIPDLYYFPADGAVMTSFGEVSRSAGTLLLDTDSCDACGDTDDIVAVFVGGPDVTLSSANLSPDPGCYLCGTDVITTSNNLPGPNGLNDVSSWSLGYSGGSSQWIRTDPLQGLGFRGVLGTGYVEGATTQVTPWPEDVIIDPPGIVVFDFPEADTGLANYGPGLTDADFTQVFTGPTGEGGFNVQYALDDGSSFFTNVTIVPEPAAASLLSLAGLALLGLRRRS